MSYTVTFEAEVAVECDDPTKDENLAQAVQDVIGHTGAVVTLILQYDEASDRV